MLGSNPGSTTSQRFAAGKLLHFAKPQALVSEGAVILTAHVCATNKLKTVHVVATLQG